MEIEIVLRMETSTDDFDIANDAIKQYFEERSIIKKNEVSFFNFHFMAAQPLDYSINEE